MYFCLFQFLKFILCIFIQLISLINLMFLISLLFSLSLFSSLSSERISETTARENVRKHGRKHAPKNVPKTCSEQMFPRKCSDRYSNTMFRTNVPKCSGNVFRKMFRKQFDAEQSLFGVHALLPYGAERPAIPFRKIDLYSAGDGEEALTAPNKKKNRKEP